MNSRVLTKVCKKVLNRKMRLYEKYILTVEDDAHHYLQDFEVFKNAMDAALE
ncbi:hypothetical protein [Maribacter sp. R77961]|uniref:hypothetical protein n=1 Tax=Maribacter sp. R77961 TaxID=3093871 RepID=UPI0037CC8923